MKCPKCNADVKEGMKFCPSCGFEIPTVNICPQCGNEILKGMSFCPKCGTSVSNNQSKVEDEKAPIDSSIQQTNETISTKITFDDGFLPLSELLSAQASDINAGMDAEELYCLACDKNDVEDYLSARKLFEKAAYLKHRESINWLGVYYANGYGVAPNDLKSASLYKIAADLGEPYAQNNLALCYLDGKGVVKNEKLAFNLFNQAMNNGHIDAICNVGYCYETGKGCKPDKEKALYYYKLSADKGANTGKKNYQILLSQNNTNQKNINNGQVFNENKNSNNPLGNKLLIGFICIVLLGGIYHHFYGSSDTPTGNPIEDANTLEAIYHDGGDTGEFMDKVKNFYWDKYGAKGGGQLFDQKLNEFMDEAQKHLDNLNNR